MRWNCRLSVLRAYTEGGRTIPEHQLKELVDNLIGGYFSSSASRPGPSSDPEEMMGRVQSVVDTSMSGVRLPSVTLAGYLGQFLPVGVVLTGCGILMAMAGLFEWFAIGEQAFAQSSCHGPKETGQTVPSLLGGRLTQKHAKVESESSPEKRKGEKR